MNDLASVIESNVAAALAEDIGGGDWTAQLIAPDSVASAHVISRSDAVVCGAPWFNECFRQLDCGTQIEWLVGEGAKACAGEKLCIVRGSTRVLLTAERTALNFLQLLPAVAATCKRVAVATADSNCRKLSAVRSAVSSTRVEPRTMHNFSPAPALAPSPTNHSICVPQSSCVKHSLNHGAPQTTASLRLITCADATLSGAINCAVQSPPPMSSASAAATLLSTTDAKSFNLPYIGCQS